MTRAADEAESLADDIRAAKGRAPDAEGATADVIAAGFDNDIADLVAIAEAAREAAQVASEQAPADAKFAAAPSKADVEAGQKAVTDAENSGADRQDIAKARNHAAALATEREDAKAEHAGVSRRTAAAFQAIKIAEVPMVHVPTPVVAYGDAQGRSGTPAHGSNLSQPSGSPTARGNTGSDTFTGESPSGGGAALSDTAAGTSLSADGSGVPMNAAQLAGQPQQPTAGQPQMGGQPTMAPMAQTGAIPTTAGRLTDPAALAKAAASRNKKKQDSSSPSAPVMAPMNFSGASGGVDRGSSTSGVTTNSNTSGSVKTALSGATLPQGTGQPAGMQRGMGMGPMMGGAPGAGGAGGAGGSKERPVIFDARRADETERSDSVQSGTLARDTALDPNIAEERERQK